MTNSDSQGTAESGSAGGLERLEKLASQGLEKIKNSISSGALKISESSVVFLCNFEWVKAGQLARCLLKPKDVKKAIQATKGIGKPTCIIHLCDNEKAAEILSTKFGATHLANTLRAGVFQSANQLPVIIPRTLSCRLRTLKCPLSGGSLDQLAPATIGVRVQLVQISPERAES